MFCPRCRSTNVKITNDSTVCRQCGFTKKGIQTTDEFTTFTKNKKRVGYVTSREEGTREAEQTDAKNYRMLKALEDYQSRLFKATQSFVQAVEAPTLVLQKVKLTWFKYLDGWAKRQMKLPASFSLKINNKRSYYHQRQQSEVSESSEEQDIIQPNDELIDVDQPSDNLTKTQQKPLKAQVRQLIKKHKTGEEAQFFNQMTKLKNWNVETLKYAMTAYCHKVYDGIEPIRNRVLSLEQLSRMAQARNRKPTRVDSIKSLTKYVWAYDLLSHTLEQKSTYPIQILVAMHRMNKNQPALTRLTIAQYSQKRQNRRMSNQMPFLDFGMIYSFIHVGTILARQPYFIDDLMHHTVIDSQPSEWIQHSAIEINMRPSAKVIRKNSIRICQFCQIRPQTLYRVWIDKILRMLEIQQYTKHVNILYRTIVENIKTLCQEDVVVMAVVCIFLKLMIGMDNEPHLAFIGCVDDKKVESTRKRMPGIMRNRVGLRYLDIVGRLRRPTPSYQLHYRNMQNVGIQQISQFLQRLQIQDQENERSMIKGVLTGFEVKQMKKRTIEIKDEREQETHEKFLKKTVTNQIPWKLKKASITDKQLYKRAVESLQPQDITLPCDNYEIIFDFKSVYRCVPRDEWFYFLENLSRGRCDADSLIEFLRKLENKLLTYETQ